LDREQTDATVHSPSEFEETFEDTWTDQVNHPEHYTTRSMEAIDIIETAIEDQDDPVLAYLMSNTIKYLLRYQHKGRPRQDLEKARWYLDRMISKLD